MPNITEILCAIERRTPRGGTPVAEALRGVLDQLRDSGSETYVFLVTDGGPNCNFTTPCGADACIPNLERLRLSEDLVLLCHRDGMLAHVIRRRRADRNSRQQSAGA